jgi:hypothetical protein
MKEFPCIIATIVTLAAASSLPARAMDENTRKILVGAAAIAGIEAIAHSQHHHDNGKHHQDEKREAEFERGDRDVLQNARFNNYSNQNNYVQGCNSGIDERQAHVRHNQSNRWESNQHAASNYLLHKGALAVADHFEVNPNHVIPQESTRLDLHEYKVRRKHGRHRPASCRIGENGRVEKVKNIS